MTDEYPTIVATIVEIPDKSKLKHIVARLQSLFSLSASEATQALESLPYRLPASYFTTKEAKTVTHELTYFGCKVEIFDVTDEEEPEEEAPPAPPPEEIKISKKPKPTVRSGAKKGGGASSKKINKLPKWAIPAAGVVLLIIVGLLFITLSEDNPKPHVATEEQPFESETLNDIVNDIESKFSNPGDMDAMMANMDSYLDELGVTGEERQLLSDHYAEKAKLKKEDESMSVGAMRSLKMLQVALVFNNRNRIAWNQMIELYEANGMKFRAKKTRREMEAAFQ